MSKAPFSLPTAPIDRYEVSYYRVHCQVRDAVVERVSAVYYVNAPYAEICPGDGRGTPFVDQWLMFCNGRASGRTAAGRRPIRGERDGHPKPRADIWENTFATLDEAVEYGKAYLARRLEYERKQLAVAEKAVVRIAKDES